MPRITNCKRTFLVLAVSLLATSTAGETTKSNNFLVSGRTLDELSDFWSEKKILPFRQAVKRFPDIDSCLMDSDNIDSIDWAAFASFEEVEVCLSRIHSDILDPFISREWFERQGFLTSLQQYNRGNPPQEYSQVACGWITSDSGPLKGRKSPLRGIWVRLEELFATGGLSVSVEMDQNGTVVNTSAGFSKK